MEQLSLFDKPKMQLSKENINNPAILRDIPYDKIYEAARKEASRKKPAFFIHKYFARRITCNFRMMLLGTLLPYEEDIWNYFYDSFETSKVTDFVVLDPFMGGGTTLFESLRLNAKTVGSDLQPLSKFVSSALIKKIDVEKLRKSQKILEKTIAPKIMQFYHTTCPDCKKEADVMYTFHVKKVTTSCSCGEHKLFSNFVLSLKKDEFTLVCPNCGDVFKHNFKADGAATCRCGYTIESPTSGYVTHGVFRCHNCKEEKSISSFSEEQGYPFVTEQIALEYYCPHCKSHDYKRVDEEDRILYAKACAEFDKIKDTLPIPNQKIPSGYNTNQILNHGYKTFRDLFNKRQLLCLGILQNAINELEDKEAQFWLQLAFSGMLEMNNMFCRYQANASKICNIFFNHAYVPITMPVENNVWGTTLGTGTFIKTIDKIIRGKAFCSDIYDLSIVNKNGKTAVEKIASAETVVTTPVEDWDAIDATHPILRCNDSRSLDFIPDSSVDLVLTDPPFGSNVMYSELIDFFHCWNHYSTLASSLGFDEPLSPKENEIIINPAHGKSQTEYEDGVTAVFSECHSKLRDNGLLIFSFHDRSMESWTSILNSIDRANFTLIKAYPLHAEARTGAHTSNKNSIALDIMLICKKKIQTSTVELTPDSQRKLIEETYAETEKIIQRLQNVHAEITIPDIENIFVSEYFSLAGQHHISYDSVSAKGAEDVHACIDSLHNYFSEYSVSERRSGWWSELYKKKWEMQ